uniref:hypothetical protein n=1 Tax=uncultured Altererythrobacter sp. TaxID=500840 RepID=UPI0026199B03|nr:hypothetical protein [uncultured Altererythrobacter sp.]
MAVFAFAMSLSPLGASTAGDDPLVGIEFSFTEIASPPTADELPLGLQPEERADWFMAEQLRRTEAATSNPNSGALASGWIGRNLYVLIEQGRITYLIRRPDPIAGSRPATDVCRILIFTREMEVIFPDIIARISESERGCDAPPSWFLKRLLNARPRAGEVSDKRQFDANDGSVLDVRHITNASAADVPLISKGAAENVRGIYQMPTSWLLARKTAQQAWIVENDDETYALAVKFDIERAGRQSGCVMEASDGRFPSLDWISGDLRDWCIGLDRAFARSLRRPEFEPRPSPPRES